MKTKLKQGQALISLIGLLAGFLAGHVQASDGTGGKEGIGGKVLFQRVAVPKPAQGPVLDPILNKVYLTIGPQGFSDVLAIDGETLAQTVLGGGQGVDVDLANDEVWGAGLYYGAVFLYAGTNGSTLGSIGLGYCPITANVDAVHRVAWVSAQCGDYNDPVWAIDSDTYAILAGPIGSGGVNGGPNAVNPATGRYYHNCSAGPQRVDPNTYAVTTTAFGPVLGVNATANLLYAEGRGGVLQIVNGARDPEEVVTTVALPFALAGDPIGVDSVRNRLYVPNPRTNSIVELDGSTGANLGVLNLGPGITGVQGLAVDTERDRIYALAQALDGSAFLWRIDSPGKTLHARSQ